MEATLTNLYGDKKMKTTSRYEEKENIKKGRRPRNLRLLLKTSWG